jgi:tRNA threonylcarbamoyladenosine biosynthesis protein TsaB
LSENATEPEGETTPFGREATVDSLEWRSNLKLLAIDTATARGSVALLEDREVHAQLQIHSLETHSARLLSSIEFLLSRTGWELKDLNLIVAGIGPGSFTGIRIGVSTALGLAQSLSAHFAGISGLEAMAHKLPGIDGRIGVVLDAQRSQVYFAEYISSQGNLRRMAKPGLFFPEELERRLRRTRIFLIGDGAIRYRKELSPASGAGPRVVEVDLFLAGTLGTLALSKKRSWRKGEFLSSEPLYIRPPDACKGKAKSR